MDIDKFINETKKFINKKNGNEGDNQTNVDVSRRILKNTKNDILIEDSIVITDDDINRFVEVVTGSGIDHPLSSTHINNSIGSDLSP